MLDLIKSMKDYLATLRRLREQKTKNKKGAFDEGEIYAFGIAERFLQSLITIAEQKLEVEIEAIAYALEQKEKQKEEDKRKN